MNLKLEPIRINYRLLDQRIEYEHRHVDHNQPGVHAPLHAAQRTRSGLTNVIAIVNAH